MSQYVRELLRRHYDYLEREHAKLSDEEAHRTRVEGQNAMALAELIDGLNTPDIVALARKYNAQHQ